MTDNLADLINESNKVDLQILLTAKEEAKRRVLEDPSAANLSALEKATNMLEERLKPKVESEPTFENRAEALKELKGQGYKIGKSKFYKDCKDGLCHIEPDGSIKESSLNRYIKHPRANLKRLDKIAEAQTAQEKTNTEIEKLRTQVRLLQHDLAVKEGKYISREDFEMEAASRCVAFKTGIEHMIESRAAEWVQAVFGEYNPEYTRLLREAVQVDFNEQFDQFARMDQFEVELGQEG